MSALVILSAKREGPLALRRACVALCLVFGLSAHIGSPNAFFEGMAGPYNVRVVVRPPEVVPGVAEVIVKTDARVTKVNVRPVFWRAGVRGAPSGDDAKPVSGQPGLYTGNLWLMSRGAYSVYVTVSGDRGDGTAIVPVAAFATGRLALSKGLGAILIALGVFLFAGLVRIIQAASGESLLEPGAQPTEDTRSRARLAGMIAAPILALLVFGAAKWWKDVDREYERLMYRPPQVEPQPVGEKDGTRTLWLRVRDTAAFHTMFAPVIPDHGKMMHLFLVRAGDHGVLGHFHPNEVDSLYFRTGVPWLPAGTYRLFGDVVLANGLSQTVTARFRLSDAERKQTPSDPDDSWSSANAVSLTPGASVDLGDGYLLAWTGQSPTDLRFELRRNGQVVSPQPYLGMAGHAVVLSQDESVFIHLHPMGTVATSAQSAFTARDRGDTTEGGRFRDGALDDAMPMSHAHMDGHLAFPYEFPKAGRYRVWVQVKPETKVVTASFDVDVR